MRRREFLETALLLPAVMSAAPETAAQTLPDPRNIRNGSPIPKEGYCDQPYVVITKDGNWLCVLTTGVGVEGQTGQHIVATISSDKGKSWSPMIDIEPANGPEASWVMPLLTPAGRVYVFYTYNKDNLRELERSNAPNYRKRVDTMGYYCFKYSDDHGRTWSKERYDIPMRLMRIDRENLYQGRVLFFWGVGKPIVHNGKMWFGFAKVGLWGNPGGMVESQGCFMRSDNILTEKDPRKLQWQLLPDGDEGLRAPKGPVSDEANLVALNDGSLYATYRTIDGYNCAAYSRDGGHHWTPSEYAVYTPGGRRIKHPRAANFVKKFANGKYLLWFHNHAGESMLTAKWDYYKDRNPGWIAAGVEKNGYIHWSQPEILLYDLDADIRISYPDLFEDGGRYYITETQKTVARVHEIDSTLLEGAWKQAENKTVAKTGLVTNLSHDQVGANASFPMPSLPSLQSGGFSIDFWARFRQLTDKQVILDARDASGKGIVIETSERFTLRLTLNDGGFTSSWDSDPGVHEGTLKIGAWQHIAVIVDGGPKLISWVVNGALNDGGPVRDFGWGRFPVALGDVNGASTGKLALNLSGELRGLRIYNRYLRTSEAVGNYQAG